MASINEDKGLSEEGIVSNFLEHLYMFNYDKAKDLVDKQKEQCKSQQNVPPIWPMILGALSQLAVAEKSYSSFLYLSPKWFSRKDAKGVYDTVAQECRKIESMELHTHGELSALAHVCGQLVPYVNLKTEMIEFFSSLHAATNVKFCDRNKLLATIKAIISRSSDKFFHPKLEQLKTAFLLECEIIEKLFEADIAMSQWKFVHSLLQLQDANSRISTLQSASASFTAKEPWKFSFLGIKVSATPVLYTWLKQLKDAIYSKFSLYFYDVLCKQAPHNDMKSYMSRCSVDYYSKLTAFHKKTDAHLISLILNSEGIEVQGPGYTHNSGQPLALHGKQAFISIFCYPPECKEVAEDSGLSYLPDIHQTSLIMMMSCKEKQLNQTDKPVDFYDEKNNCTYIISRVDPKVSIVVIYKAKKSDREKKSMVSFLQDVNSQLRYVKLFHDLRPS